MREELHQNCEGRAASERQGTRHSTFAGTCWQWVERPTVAMVVLG